MIRRPPRSTRKESSAASDVYKRQDILLSEELNKFTSNGGKIQIRSVLIQGLLMMKPNLIPSNVQKTRAGVSYFQDTAKELNINKIHLAILCINYLLPEAEIIIGIDDKAQVKDLLSICLLYTSPSPRDAHESRMPSSA